MFLIFAFLVFIVHIPIGLTTFIESKFLERKQSK